MPPCAEGSGGIELCPEQTGPNEAVSTVVILGVGPGIASSYLKSLAARLVDQDQALAEGVTLQTVRVVTFDPRGTGATGHPSPPSYALADYASDLEAVRAKLGVEQIHILAQGWSALIAYHYLREHSAHVRSLILSGAYAPRVGPNTVALDHVQEQIMGMQNQAPPLIPNPIPPDVGDDCNPAFAATLPAYFFYWPDAPPAELSATACSASAKSQALGALQSVPYDYAADTAAFTGPVLVLMGKNDAHGGELADAVAGSFPTAGSAISVPSSGHYPWMDANADQLEFETHIWTFLAANP